jgi:hypothetical protein
MGPTAIRQRQASSCPRAAVAGPRGTASGPGAVERAALRIRRRAFAFLVVRPEATKTQVKRIQDWLMSHARELMAGVALFAGAYMVISGLVRLS